MGENTGIAWTDHTFPLPMRYCAHMPGTAEGAHKRRAAKAGLTVEQYDAKVANGERWCTRCKGWHDIVAFGSDSNRSDGIAASCRASRNAHQRATYEPRERQRGRRYVEARDGDRSQARGRVNHLIRVGVLPDPNALPCADCGHLGPDRRHEYDHHAGYAPECHEIVESVCTLCHARRSDERGESRHVRDERGRYASLEVMPCGSQHRDCVD